MIKFNKILCPYDFSEFADASLNLALKLAEDGTKITLMNIIQLPSIIDPYGVTYYDMKADELVASSKKALEDKCMEVGQGNPKVQLDCRLDKSLDPAEEILQVQKEEKYDLIIMGSHGRKGLSRLLMGSVTESVMREADCPVLIIKKV